MSVHDSTWVINICVLWSYSMTLSISSCMFCRLPDSPVCAVESTLKLPARSSFPFEYKYFVRVSQKNEDCYEHLTLPTRGGGKVNRYIFNEYQLLPGKEGVYEIVLSDMNNISLCITCFFIHFSPYSPYLSSL